MRDAVRRTCSHGGDSNGCETISATKKSGKFRGDALEDAKMKGRWSACVARNGILLNPDSRAKRQIGVMGDQITGWNRKLNCAPNHARNWLFPICSIPLKHRSVFRLSSSSIDMSRGSTPHSSSKGIGRFSGLAESSFCATIFY